VKKVFEQGHIGEPYYIESKVQGSRNMLFGWRAFALNGGGMIYDWGVHLIDQLMWMIDSPVVSVFVHGFSLYNPEVDDNFKLFMRFENGLSALVEIATNNFMPQPRWYFNCKEGTGVCQWSCDGKLVKLKNPEITDWEDTIVYTDRGPTRTMAPRPDDTTQEIALPRQEANSWEIFYPNLLDAIDGKAEQLVKPEEALRVMKVIDAAFESMKTGKSVSLHV